MSTINTNTPSLMSFLNSNSSQQTSSSKLPGLGGGISSASSTSNLLSANFLGSNSGLDFLGATPTQISGTAQMLASREKSLSKLAVGVLDSANLIQAANDGLHAAGSQLTTIKALLLQAQSTSLTADQKMALDQKIKGAVADYTKLVDGTRYSNRKVLAEDSTTFVPTSDKRQAQGVSVSLTNISAQKLGLDKMDISSPLSVGHSLDKVNAGLQTILKTGNKFQASYSQLTKTADSFQKSMQALINALSVFDTSAATSTAQTAAAGNLTSAQGTSQSLNSLSLLG